MKVLRIVGGLDPASGGTSSATINECIAVQAAGVDNTLLYPFHPSLLTVNDSTLESLHTAGVRTRRFRISRIAGRHSHRWAVSPRLSAWTFRELHHYDLVHIYGAWGVAQLIAVEEANHARVPCVMTPQESLTRFDIATSSSVPPHLKRMLRRRYMARLSLIVFSSLLEARDSMLNGAKAHAVVIPHPVTEIGYTQMASHREAKKTLVIGFLGRLHPKKNVELLIKAVARVPETQLLIAGDGPSDYRCALEKLVDDLDVHERVKWLGFVKGAERDSFLDSIAVLAMPSDYECFGMAAAEAMARGVPPVVSSQCGIGEVISRRACGFVIPCELEEWVTMFSTLAQGLPLDDMRHRSLEAARSELSMDAFGARLRKEYELLLAARA
jgi:glycosyltransferase involved in cell wall biosynthesis